MALLECVPNVSEGRDPARVAAFAETLRQVPGAWLLDVHADPVHNRSVFTLAGGPAALVEAAVRLTRAAIAAIDLRRHAGVHPRLGAIDVIPFVPLQTTPMAAAVAAADEAARRIGDTLELPVYLYESAARVPARRRLEDVRRGQFEGLAARMQTPDGQPDAGPATPHPTAGAVAVGARDILVAFNVTLASDRLEAARAVARAVRASTGGLPCLKAMGVDLPDRGVVQVSMNLTDYRVTTAADAFDAVSREAARLGLRVAASELVGLMPVAALGGRHPGDLLIADWHAGRLLETRLAELRGATRPPA
ncbi:MAG: glutamate formimidoyltransferase [Vicinamibacterales bacterium]